MPYGPVQMLVVGFDGPDFDGDLLAEFERLRDSRDVRVIDVLVVRKDAGGVVHRVERPESTGDVLEALLGADARGQGEDDVWSLDDVIPSDSSAVIALVEHRWAIGTRDAIRAAGGIPVADAWIHPADLAAAGLIDAEADHRSLAHDGEDRSSS